MVSKGDLGVGYLVAVGVVLCGVFSTGFVVPTGARGQVDSQSLLGVSMGVMIAGSFLATGVGLARSTLDDDHVWRVAGWSTLGLGLPTLVAILVIVLAPSSLQGIGWRSVVMVDIAAGGVVGVLVGSILELRAEHDRTRTLNQRNTVFLRLFRHDIRTSLNLIRGHLDLAADDRSPLSSTEVVRDQLAHIERLSEAAKRLDDLESMTRTEPVDLGSLVCDRVEEIRRTEDVVVETYIDDAAPVRANELLSPVVDNLLRNAVEHGTTSNQTASDDAVEHGPRGNQIRADGAVEHGTTGNQTASADAVGHDASNDQSTADVIVRVSEDRRDDVTLRIRDYGPGFDETELAVHRGEAETALQHSDGIGLWLVRWIVDAYDGTVDVANADDGGAVVTVMLPTAVETAD